MTTIHASAARARDQAPASVNWYPVQRQGGNQAIMLNPLRMLTLALLLLVCLSGYTAAEIYQWTDEDGQVHFGDSNSKPAEAVKTDIGPVNSAVAPTPLPRLAEPSTSNLPEKKPAPVMTAGTWASQHCQQRLRILYTERSFIPCVPTDEVAVYICDAAPPRNYRNYFGRQYRYEDRESECGPEVYEGELLYLKK